MTMIIRKKQGDDAQWYMMIYDDIWWYMMMHYDTWWRVIVSGNCGEDDSCNSCNSGQIIQYYIIYIYN